MKRSKILLGVTTALLAIAGIAASKAHRGEPVQVYYGTLARCGVIVTGHCYTPTILTSCTAYGNRQIRCKFNAFPLYTDANCTTSAYKQRD